VAQQVWGGLPESFAQQAFRVDNVWSGHRGDVLSRVLWKVRSKAPTVTASVSKMVVATGEGYTTIRDSTSPGATCRRSSGRGREVWTWHRRMAEEGTWDRVLQMLTAAAAAEGLVGWSISVDSTIARAHQHAMNTTWHTGGWIEVQESAG
ncbi:hypothetical protein MUG60_00005, partial [Kaistella montana]|nr:hypothetical protein [Kaistella montana]